MLFDLFAIVNTETAVDRRKNPFASLDHYHSIPHYTQESLSEYAQVISLHKHSEDKVSVFQNDLLEVYIFGYCFTRLDSSKFSEKGRLDATRIAHCYQEWKAEFLTDIKGSFAILIIDKATRTIEVFTDPLNVKPVYYYRNGPQLVVSTALSVLLRHLQEESLSIKLNYPAILEYYLFEYPLNEDTFIHSISTVPPGGWLHFSRKGFALQKYWNIFEQLSKFEITQLGETAINTLEEVLKKNQSLYLFDPERTAVALTGGYDSRTNLALLGDKAHDLQFYSYGITDTYDLTIPKQIAQQLQLNYQPIPLDEQYLADYNANAQLAIDLGDGIAEANRGNYIYAFQKLGKNYDHILTGLFGSELIKHPTSIGNFINQSGKQLLEVKRTEQEKYLDVILNKIKEEDILNRDLLKTYYDEVKQRVLVNPYVVNEYPLPIKYFYFLLGVGIRKYFMKEIKVERPFVENLHPFFDLEFIEALLQTPFPWVHHWSGKKNLIKSIETHKLYVELIQRNQPELASILSTHGYTPRYLTHKLLLPIVPLQYLFYKNKIKSKGSFQSMVPIATFFEQLPPSDSHYGLFNPSKLQYATIAKNTIKLRSLQQWLDKYLYQYSLEKL